MSAVELTQDLLARIAGWEVVKQARELVATGRVEAAEWSPPLLRGVVREGGTSLRAGLQIRSVVDVENLCTCRQARAWGTMCAHSVAVGLHYLRRQAPSPPGARGPEVGTGVGAGGAAPAQGTRAGAVSPPPIRGLRRAADDAPGEPVELAVIFPPNLVQAIGRGKVMLVFEAIRPSGRGPLNTLPRSTAWRLGPEDAALVEALGQLTGDEAPAMALLSVADVVRLLRSLIGHSRLTLGKGESLTVGGAPWGAKVRATLEASGEILLEWAGASAPATLSGAEETWVFTGTNFRPLGLPVSCRELWRQPVRLARERVPPFLLTDWPQLEAAAEVTANFRLEAFQLEQQAPRLRLHLTGGLAHLQGTLECVYGDRVLPPGQQAGAAVWLPDPGSPTRYCTRHLPAELAAQARLRAAGFTGPHAQGQYQLAGERLVLDFFAREFPRLQREWEVRLEERLERSTAKNLERVELQFRVVPSGEQWFDLEVAYTSASGERLAPAEIQRLLRAGETAVRLRNGRRALVDTGAVEELEQVLLDCDPQQRGGAYRLNAVHAGYLEATLREGGVGTLQAPPAWQAQLRQLRGEAPPVRPGLGSLDTVLRPYQNDGVAWLWGLRQQGLGGILADEMGLGKTLQILAYVAAVVADAKAGTTPPCVPKPPGAGAARPVIPALVVCPTSLVFNWVAEAKRFTPGLRVLALAGPEREARFADAPASDLVVTSYALIRRDAAHYRGWEFDTVVLDEAQHIKNRETQNAQAVKGIGGQHRFVLTGTPLENSVLDLWSIFDFLMPGYLGSAAEFRERYELPLMREREASVRARLARRVRPFLRRRLKQEVAPELPARLEQVSYCELTDDQAAVYRQVLEAGRREVHAAVDQQGLARSRLVVLTALLRLRQVCCDLRLLGAEAVNPATASAKLDLFRELLQEALDGGHRLLVFSQFTRMLAILRETLDGEALPYCYLDGATTDRAGAVARFQAQADIPVFLISLKAGGTGLNLTGADTVIHFDPWWNPAVEAQATDRAHRIGQTRTVTSYKLIARGTVEEKILRLQERKRELVAAALGGEESWTAALSWEETQALFAED